VKKLPMRDLIEQINDIDFHPRGEGLLENLNLAQTMISNHLDTPSSNLIAQDFKFYSEKGKFGVHNTFAGGIIFLREPETIEGIKIEFNTELNSAVASVEYGSEKRNERNVKYKPNAGKIESTEWNMLAIFANFSKYEKTIRIALMSVIGKIVQRICEDYKKTTWFMEFEKAFEIELFLDGELELKYQVEILE